MIQRASERALEHGTNLSGVLDVAKQIREQSKAGLIIFSYLNPILQFGLEAFCAAAAVPASTVRWSPIFPSRKRATISRR